MDTKLIILIEKEKNERFELKARNYGKTPDEVISEFVDDYIRRHEAGGLGELMDEIGEDFMRRGITQKDIDRTIVEVKKRSEE